MPSASTLSLTLDDGTPLLLRPITRADRGYIEQAWPRLSDASRYLRFFTPMHRLSDDQLDYLTDLDQHDHVAWGALHPDEDELAGIGIGRFIRLPEEPQTAEVAITVVDTFQQRGLGSVLFALLYLRAVDEHVTTLRAFLLPENQALAHRLQALGGEVTHADGTSTVNLTVYSDLQRLPDNSHSAAFRDLLTRLQQAIQQVP